MAYRHILVPTDGSARSRRGIAAAVQTVLLGSQTVKVLAHLRIPALVCR